MRLRNVLFLLFTVVPLTEIALFIVIGGWIGLGATILLVIVTALVGSALVSRQGREQLDRLRSTVAAGAFPGVELAHGAMILVAGALLVTPGFLTDAVGFLLLVPPLREMLRRWWQRRFTDRIETL